MLTYLSTWIRVDMESQIIAMDQFTMTIDSVHETISSLRQAMDVQQVLWTLTREVIQFD